MELHHSIIRWTWKSSQRVRGRCSETENQLHGLRSQRSALALFHARFDLGPDLLLVCRPSVLLVKFGRSSRLVLSVNILERGKVVADGVLRRSREVSERNPS